MASLNKILQLLIAVNNLLIRVGKSIAWVCVALMVAAILIQVFFRYLLNNALPWPEEAARALMIWMMALVAAGAYREGGFIAIDFFIRALPATIAKILQLVLLLAAGVVLVELFIMGTEFFQRGFRTRAASFNLPRAWIYLAMPVCFGTMLLVNLELILKQLLPSNKETVSGAA